MADALNFTKAAAKLRLAQPALSRQVQDLEEEIGVDLLTRSPRGVALTAEGKLFLDEARGILAMTEEAVAKTRALARGEFGELHVGYSPSPSVELLPPALKAFQKAYPRIRVHLHDLAGNELAEGLRSGRLHLAVMQQPREGNAVGLQFEMVRSYPICVLAPRDHPLAKRRSVPLAALSTERLVIFNRRDYADYQALLSRILKGLGKRPAIAAECDGASSLFTEVEAGRGVAILPQVFSKIISRRLVLRPLTPPQEPQPVGIVRAVKGDVTPAGERFCQFIRDIGKTI